MSSFRSHPTLVGVVVLAALALAATPAPAQQVWQSYAAKFVCGPHVTPPPAKLSDGRYKTVVNIHNPNYLLEFTGLPVPIFFQKKIVLSVPQGEMPLPPSCLYQEFLIADHSMQVDCAAIKSQLALSGLPATGAIEGFVVIIVGTQPLVDPPLPPPLDVVTVYSSRPDGGAVTTMDVERVPAVEFFGTPVFDPCPD